MKTPCKCPCVSTSLWLNRVPRVYNAGRPGLGRALYDRSRGGCQCLPAPEPTHSVALFGSSLVVSIVRLSEMQVYVR